VAISPYLDPRGRFTSAEHHVGQPATATLRLKERRISHPGSVKATQATNHQSWAGKQMISLGISAKDGGETAHSPRLGCSCLHKRVCVRILIYVGGMSEQRESQPSAREAAEIAPGKRNGKGHRVCGSGSRQAWAWA